MRNASVWAFSGLFSCISLLGPGWHCFFGHPFHGSSESHAFCGAHDVFDDHDQAADCATHDHDAVHPGHAPAATAVHDHDCPICKFFAQAQWALDWRPAEFEFAVSDAASHLEPSARAVRIAFYRSRAPPANARIS
jgi:hypothetical protein